MTNSWQFFKMISHSFVATLLLVLFLLNIFILDDFKWRQTANQIKSRLTIFRNIILIFKFTHRILFVSVNCIFHSLSCDVIVINLWYPTYDHFRWKEKRLLIQLIFQLVKSMLSYSLNEFDTTVAGAVAMAMVALHEWVGYSSVKFDPNHV